MLRRKGNARVAHAARAVLGLLLAAPAPLLLAQEPPRAAVSDAPAPGVVRMRLDPQQYDGYPIALVFYDLLGGSGDVEEDRALRERIERTAAPLGTGPFSPALADRALAEIRALPGVGAASYSLYASERPGEVVLVVSATLIAGAQGAERPAPDQFTVLIESDQSIVRVQLNGGNGMYADYNPWFGSPETYAAASPIALDPPGPGTTSWAESWLEYGLAWGARLADSATYAFAEATALASASTGQDLFRSDTRSKTLTEKAYAGLLWARPELRRAARLSIGRQNWQLDDGFLFSRYSAGANAGPNASLYLNPRTTYEHAVLAELKLGRLGADFFDVDPAELEDFDSGTRFRGVNVAWLATEGWEIGATAYRVKDSSTVFRTPQGGTVPRDGQRTLSLRVGHEAAAGSVGLSVVAAYARQDHSHADVSARAWYAQIGYTARERRSTPSITYRYARFSGDDPDTPEWESFDAPLSGGLDEWVQGVNFKKVVGNSNLRSHRLRVNFAQSARLNYTIDYFRLWADVPMATGERSYGDEVDFTVRWAFADRLFFLGVAGIAWPSELIRSATGGAQRRWATAQASLFWGF